MSGPTKNDSFADKAELREKFALGAGLIVVLGLLLESGPEIAKSILDLTWPKREICGGVLVTIGVGFEVFFSWQALNLARKAEFEAELLISQANERAAQAEKLAAEANLERIKLEIRLADRRVSDDQVLALGSALSSFTGKVMGLHVIDENEAIRFCNELKSGFDRAGITIFEIQKFSPGGIDRGVVLNIGKGAEQFADAISNALVESGVLSHPPGTIRMIQEGQVALRIGPK